jgi:hypothetical protein
MADRLGIDVPSAVRRGSRRAIARLARLWLTVLVAAAAVTIGAGFVRSKVTADDVEITPTGRALELSEPVCGTPVLVGERSTCAVELRSAGVEPVTVNEVSVVTDDPTDQAAWSLSAPCTGTRDPGGTCRISVEFAAGREPGPHSASLIVAHDAPGGSSTVGLAVEVVPVDPTPPASLPSIPTPRVETTRAPTTTQTPSSAVTEPTTEPTTERTPEPTPEPAPEPVIDVADASCDQDVYIGESPASCVVEVSAIGQTPVTIERSVVDPVDAEDVGRWVVEQDCVGVLAPGATCVIGVRFTAGPPADVHRATLAVAHDASPGTTSVDLAVQVFDPVE